LAVARRATGWVRPGFLILGTPWPVCGFSQHSVWLVGFCRLRLGFAWWASGCFPHTRLHVFNFLSRFWRRARAMRSPSPGGAVERCHRLALCGPSHGHGQRRMAGLADPALHDADREGDSRSLDGGIVRPGSPTHTSTKCKLRGLPSAYIALTCKSGRRPSTYTSTECKLRGGGPTYASTKCKLMAGPSTYTSLKRKWAVA